MSKSWFHFCVMTPDFTILEEGRVANQPDAISEFMTQLYDQLGIQLKEVVLCMEHTGIYVQHLVRGWLGQGGRLSLVAASKISEQMAGPQGWEEKTDSIDARRLAEYGIRFRDRLEAWQLKSDLLEKLQRLQRQRERIQKAINLLTVAFEESEAFDAPHLSAEIQANQARSVKALKADLKRVEKRLTQLIEQDEYFNQLFKLITSVEGVGPVIAREVIITTAGFTKFTPNQAKKYARYIGIAPMKWQSGSSMKKRERTPKRKNKKMKPLLTMGARSLIPLSGQLSQYYHRKRQEGKSYRCVINAMRNKLILRIFAVVRDQVMYQKNFEYCLE